MLAELTARAEGDYLSPVAIAIVHLGLGNADAALNWTERACDDRHGWLAYLTVNPQFDGLRDRARFKRLVARMQLAPTAQ